MRFLSTFNSGIQEAPLQVYHSGLAFTPLDTILGRIYSDLCSSVWNVQSPIDKSHWDSTLRRFDCDGEIVDCVTFSNDGRLASGSRRGIIRVWSPSSGDLLCKLEWTDHSIQYLAFSPEGQLASLSSTSIRVWDLDTRQPLQTIDPGQVQSPFSAVFSRCNAFLYYFHGIQSAYMYDWRKRQLLHVQHFHEAAYHTVLATNGDWLARCHSGRIRLSRWDDADTRQQHSELSFGGGGMYINLAFSSDTKLLAAKDLTGNILIWDVETCQLRHMFQMNPSWRRPMTFSQSYFLEGGENGTIYIYDLEKKALLQPIPAHSQKIGSLAFSDKHHMIVSTSRGGKCVKTWDPSNQEVFNAGTIAANKLSFGFGSEFLITPGSGCEAGLMNLRKGTSITAFPRHFRFLAVSEVTPLLACVGESSIEIWDTQQWSLKATLPLPGATADAACFSTDGTKLAISLKGSVLPLSLRRAELCIYNVDTQLCEWSIYPLHDDGVGSMALYTEGPVKVLAFATSRAMVCMTDISKGATTEYRSGASASVAFINGGTQLLMVDEKWGGSVIDTATGARLWHWPALATGARHTLLDMSFFKRVINLDKDLAPELQFAELINSRHISKDGSWIMEGTERVLWLPMQHRPRFAALSGSLLAISTETGGFLLLEHKE